MPKKTEPVESVEKPSEPTTEPVVEPKKLELTEGDLQGIISRAVSEGIKQKDEEYKAKQREWTQKDRERKKGESKKKPQVDPLDKYTDAIKEAIKTGDDTIIDRVRAEVAETQNQQTAIDQHNERVEDKRDEFSQKILDVGLDPNDDTLLDVWETFEWNSWAENWSFADRKLDRIIKNLKKEPEKEINLESKEKPTLTDEERAEIARAYMEKEGLLETHEATPTGGATKDKDIIEAYAMGDATEEQYLQAKKNLGI